jgi:hypothetical protein
MLAALDVTEKRFVRRTFLSPNEYRTNFRQIDCGAIEAITSPAACAVTPLMSKIYLRLLNAPPACREREGVLRFAGGDGEGKSLTAWEQLVALTGVANSTLSKALAYLHQVGAIGYEARKNGVGIRIFLNRASASIRTARPEKNLRLVSTPTVAPRTPSVGVPFKEYSSGEVLEADLDPRAQSRAAGHARGETAEPDAPPQGAPPNGQRPWEEAVPEQVASLIRRELEGAVAAACRREAERTREWLEQAGLPKAARVAQREAYNLLRAHGLVKKNVERNSTTPRDRICEGREVESQESREETIRLCVAMASEVRGIGLDEFLGEYVTRGEMTEGEALTLLREAREMDLWGGEGITPPIREAL